MRQELMPEPLRGIFIMIIIGILQRFFHKNKGSKEVIRLSSWV